jgi:hypothetical protein
MPDDGPPGEQAAMMMSFGNRDEQAKLGDRDAAVGQDQSAHAQAQESEGTDGVGVADSSLRSAA